MDDPNGATFTDAILLPAIGEAVDALWGAFVFFEIPKSKVVTTYTLSVGVTSVTPATMGIADFGELIQLQERLSGSNDFYVNVVECDSLPQRPQVDILGVFEWRGDAFYFIGSTAPRQLQVSYFSTTGQPAALDSTSTGVDGALTFLTKYAAGIVGPRKGYDEMAAMYMKQAVGPRYDEGLIGGELFRLCQPMVRSRQRVQVAPKPYSAIRRRRMPNRQVYIAANSPAGGAVGAPAQFSTETGTITGTIDGSNATFYLLYPVTTANIYRNGVLMTQTTDVTFGANQMVFQSGQIPQPGDVISAQGWT